jgi:hypothetical protein
MDQARSRDPRVDRSCVRTLRRHPGRCILFALAVLAGSVPLRAETGRQAHLKSVDRVAIDAKLDDPAKFSRLSAPQWKEKLEQVAGDVLRGKGVEVAAGAPRRLRILVSTRASTLRPNLRAALVIVDLRERGLVRRGDRETAEEDYVVITWSIAAVVLAGPKMFDTCIARAVEGAATDFARQVTRGIDPRSRSEACTIVRIDRR